ncbi:DNA polymerase III subunit chi [Mergibacter septicus]|uniref:DNA polymerase III subunit chi n=1 Tax=Mergibacter septicus TaxID=221402 RepID=A0A8D4LKE4_9PAST|nr:DNA polymerase III subunit chi [Mergibacter septicus]AWX13237.1 DNA polymerase III subunit chi [Mergibacter septicus]AWX15142.1 DNA polymerase III subunit chi [Mergibacter septicus]QDJ14395.1 DNA polymerase III subunit chi [Mergibacter septicus]UTU48166.1 DNA polymerase III subunit chi [Mergibacter septicus]WMR96216.1 DNA polymerase III subunit chi [Mergibacter septicus]
MAKQALFYLLQQNNTLNQLTADEALACDLAAQAWRLGKKVLLACEDEQQAFRLDDALWQRHPDQFVPHNLSGELTGYAGTPVEICWVGKRNSQQRDILINLQQTVPDFVYLFHQVIDFVASDEQKKILARERYKQYRALGFEMKTEQA